jgi:hypothetical protein
MAFAVSGWALFHPASSVPSSAGSAATFFATSTFFACASIEGAEKPIASPAAIAMAAAGNVHECLKECLIPASL